MSRTRRGEGRCSRRCAAPGGGRFVAPTVIAVDGIGAVEREVFGPVLHVAGFRAGGARPGGGRDQRPRLRADLRAAQPHRRPGGAGDGAAQRGQRLRQPQPDRRHRRLAAVRRRGAERDRAEGGRAVLSAAGCSAGRPEPAPAAPEGPEVAPEALASALAALDAGRLGGAERPAGGAAHGARGRRAGWSARRSTRRRRCRRRRSTCRGRPARATG